MLNAGWQHAFKNLQEQLEEAKSKGFSVDLSAVEPLDLEGKITVKEVAEAFNKLLEALKN